MCCTFSSNDLRWSFPISLCDARKKNFHWSKSIIKSGSELVNTPRQPNDMTQIRNKECIPEEYVMKCKILRRGPFYSGFGCRGGFSCVQNSSLFRISNSVIFRTFSGVKLLVYFWFRISIRSKLLFIPDFDSKWFFRCDDQKRNKKQLRPYWNSE